MRTYGTVLSAMVGGRRRKTKGLFLDRPLRGTRKKKKVKRAAGLTADRKKREADLFTYLL
jgi:hypothetical protein